MTLEKVMVQPRSAALHSHVLQSGTPKSVVSDPLPVQEVEQRTPKTTDDSPPVVLPVSEHPLRQPQEAEQQWKRQAADFRHVTIEWQQASIDVDSRLTPSLNLLSSFPDRPYRNRGTLLTHLGQPELAKDIYSDHDHLTVMCKLVPAILGPGHDTKSVSRHFDEQYLGHNFGRWPGALC